jgi:cytochrome c2
MRVGEYVMKRFLPILLLTFLLTLAACGRQLPDDPIADAGDAEAAAVVEETATEEAAAEDEATDEEAATEDEATDAESAAEDEATDAESAAEEEAPAEDEGTTIAGDPAVGAELFVAVINGGAPCSSCHYVDSEDRLVGPGMLGLGERAATRVEGQSAEEYLLNSILHPGDYIVETYPEGVMPQNYGDLISEEELTDIVAYLASL